MDESTERRVMNDLLMATLKEQRRARRWSIFFRLLSFVFLFTLVGIFMGWISPRSPENETSGPHTAVVNLSGTIAANGEANNDTVVEGLKAAFEDPNTKGVILRANSPGGSPVQAGMMYDEIVRLKKMHPKIPMYVVIEDICASGCYYTAVAADKIFADKASIVGSIGVLMDGFGFTGTMEKLGVERRLLTAGANKGFLDPYSPVSAEQKEKALVMLHEIHEQFINVVRAGRGKRLVSNNPDLFSGLVWSGESSIKLGLIDGLGSVSSVARDVIKADTLVDFTPQPSYADRLARQLGVAAATTLGSKLGLSIR